MLAGNTAPVPAALTIDVEGLSAAGRLLARVLSRPLLHSIADPFFRDLANDVAVSVSSMETVPGPRTPLYEVRPVACDHLSYFAHEAGLEGLSRVLGV